MELNISHSTLEQLCCSICKGYLSCAPIRILPDGGNICGRCSPPDKDVPAYVQFSLEAIMREATFPCKFLENGCKIRLSFGYDSINEHEAECVYRNGPVESTVVLHNTELRVKQLDGSETAEKEIPSLMDDSKVINPFNIRKTSNATSSVISARSFNRNFNSPPHSPRGNSWNGSVHGRNNDYNYQRNWNPYYNSYRRRGYNNNRRNDTVVIKGHTIYVTL